jgi:hypothetical protein
MLSARDRTKREFSRPDNYYIVTKFRLPDPTAGDITLFPSDILDQFTLPFDIFITQGGTLKDGKIWYLFGFGREEMIIRNERKTEEDPAIYPESEIVAVRGHWLADHQRLVVPDVRLRYIFWN